MADSIFLSYLSLYYLRLSVGGMAKVYVNDIFAVLVQPAFGNVVVTLRPLLPAASNALAVDIDEAVASMLKVKVADTPSIIVKAIAVPGAPLHSIFQSHVLAVGLHPLRTYAPLFLHCLVGMVV